MSTPQQVFFELDQRRRDLGIGYAKLAERAGISLPTVVRILSGNHSSAQFDNVVAIAKAMDAELMLVKPRASETRKRQATQKADRIIGMLQATSGLEGQGLDQESLNEMREKTVHELLVGSPRKLWG